MEGKFDGRKRVAGGATVKPGGQLQSSERRKGGEREEKAREQMNGHMSGDRGEIPDESWSPD